MAQDSGDGCSQSCCGLHGSWQWVAFGSSGYVSSHPEIIIYCFKYKYKYKILLLNIYPPPLFQNSNLTSSFFYIFQKPMEKTEETH